MPHSPVPDSVHTELRRIETRWRQLSLDDARIRMPRVRAVVIELADATVPDLGESMVIDQLTVTAYDACAAGDADRVLDLLTTLRRNL